MKNYENNAVYVVWAENDDTSPFVCGIATSESRANKIVKRMEKVFGDFLEYEIIPILVDTNLY